MIIDTSFWLDKLVTPNVEPTNRRRKSAKDLIDKEYGADFSNLFDIALDITQLSNKDLIGDKFLNYLDNYAVDVFMQNID